MRRVVPYLSALALSVPLAAPPCAALEFGGLSRAEILDRAGALLSTRSAELVTASRTRSGALESVIEVTETRLEIMNALGREMRMTSMPAIVLADAIDDSLLAHLGPLFDAYREANPEPILNSGAERLQDAVDRFGFVNTAATGFLVHLEMQQTSLTLAEFRRQRSEAEIEGAEDAFLRHYGALSDLYEAQHVSFEDLHACNVANLEWAIGRFQTEEGVGNFFIANQFLSFKDNEYSYVLKLQSQDTAEVQEARYPLPWMTRMDEGWQRMQQEKAQNTGGEGR